MGILLQQPALSINAHDVGWPSYDMWRTIDAPEGTTPGTAAGWIFATNMEAMKTWKTPLRNIVLNAHGYPGKVSIGGMGHDHIYPSDLSVVGILKKMNVGTIWLCGCRAAQGPTGISFCSALAVITGTQVIASDTSQEVTPSQAVRYLFLGAREIDDFEGTVYSFTPGARRTIIDPQRDVATVEPTTQHAPIIDVDRKPRR